MDQEKGGELGGDSPEQGFSSRRHVRQHCKMAVESMVGKLSGVESVSVDLAAGTVEVKYNAEQVDTEAIEGAIAGAGYDVVKDS